MNPSLKCGGKLTWRVEEGVGDLFVCSVVGTRLTVGWWDSGVGFHTVGQGFRQRRHFYLEDHTHTKFYVLSNQSKVYIRIYYKGIHIRRRSSTLLLLPAGGA